MNPTQQENPTNKAKPDFYSKPSSRPAQGRFKRFLVLILSFVFTRYGGRIEPVGMEL